MDNADSVKKVSDHGAMASVMETGPTTFHQVPVSNQGAK